jgi:predicted transposase/invertase (TIGR01784 family)
MSFDNLCKLLAEKHPLRFATWVLGQSLPSAEVLKTELSIEPIRADSVTFLQTAGRILHLEFQTTWTSNPPLPLRLLDYWVRLHRLYRLPITQVVVVLLPPSDGTEIESIFELEGTRHSFQVLKLWQQDPVLFLQDPVLLPFAPLAEPENSSTFLDRVARQVRDIMPIPVRQEVSSYVQIMAGLKYDKEEIRRVFREGMMRESVIYQEILQEGEEIGLQKGRQEGERLGIERVAVNMLAKGIAPETIAELTGLTLEQIQHLQFQR